ncbi:hypothetical protein AB0M46_49065 [Dactylosporangium sp. NPDC051485]|uniref:hypothetical protein n=1 Tax=Dactylosporangium sp. NPDC051485 TaxID=3154846 RepID=UPI003417ABED
MRTDAPARRPAQPDPALSMPATGPLTSPFVSGVAVPAPAAAAGGAGQGVGRGVALVVALLAVVLLGGCGGAGDGGATSAAASGEPAEVAGKEALAAAVKALGESGYAYTMKIDQGTVTGVVESSGKRQARLDGVASGVRFSIEGIVLGGEERYFRTSIPATGVSAKKWYRFDRTKVGRTGIIGLFETDDPTSSRDLAGRVGAAKLEHGRITGTYDLTRGGDLGVTDRGAIAALGERAKRAPFAAGLDGQGRLSSIRITVPAYGSTPERTLAVDYQKQGMTVQVAVPKAAEVAQANAAVYNLLNN